MAGKRTWFRGGEGPPLVLLHSGFSRWVEWRSVLERLTQAHEVIAPTLPGSDGGPRLDLRGRTILAAHADHVEELLNDAGWTEPAPVAGSSFGGVAALELAARGRGRDVVALAPPWVAGMGVPFYLGLFAPMMGALRVTEPVHGRYGARAALGLALHGSRRPVAISSADAAALLRSFGRAPRLEWARARRDRGPGMPDTTKITTPVTLVWGTADRLVPSWMGRRWEAALPRARVVTLAGFPHVPHLRDPERIANLILAAADH